MRRCFLLLFSFYASLAVYGSHVEELPYSMSEKLRLVSKVATDVHEKGRYEKALDLITNANGIFNDQERNDVRAILLQAACLIASGDRKSAMTLLSRKREKGYSSSEWKSAYTGVAVEMTVGMTQENLQDSRLDCLLETILRGYAEVEVQPLQSGEQEGSCLSDRMIRLRNANQELHLYPRLSETNRGCLPRLLPPGDYEVSLIYGGMVFERPTVKLMPWSRITMIGADFSPTPIELMTFRENRRDEAEISMINPKNGECVSASTNSLFQWTGRSSTDSGFQLILSKTENSMEHHVVWGPIFVKENDISFPPKSAELKMPILPGNYHLFIGNPMENDKAVIQGKGVFFEIVP